MKIYAPIENVNGIYASVLFVDSVGECDNPALIEWFRSHGYRIGESERVENSTTTVRVVEDADVVVQPYEPDFDSMTPNELRDWMREHGYGAKIKNTRNKEKLLEILRG